MTQENMGQSVPKTKTNVKFTESFLRVLISCLT